MFSHLCRGAWYLPTRFRSLVPFHVAGFDQLEKRLQQQDGAMITYDEQLQLAREQIAQMQAQHDLQLKIEIPRLKKQLADISHR